MVKHTINFQIGDQFTVDDLKTIATRKYARQICWGIRLGENSYLSTSLDEIIKIFTTIGETVCEVCCVDEDYCYLDVRLKCANPELENEVWITHLRLSGRLKINSDGREYLPRTQKGNDAIREYTEDEIAYREHMSEFHGWNPRW